MNNNIKVLRENLMATKEFGELKAAIKERNMNISKKAGNIFGIMLRAYITYCAICAIVQFVHYICKMVHGDEAHTVIRKNENGVYHVYTENDESSSGDEETAEPKTVDVNVSIKEEQSDHKIFVS